ncbi:MAG: IS21 family transposase [Candidatus Binatia bacterium]
MIAADIEAEILRLHYAERWPTGTIARQLGLHHSTVRRVLAQAGIAAGRQSARSSIADPYFDFITQTLEKYPRLSAARLFAMVQGRGYGGGPDHFRSVVARMRPRKPAEAYLRLRTLPGEQAQVDWGHFGKITVGRAERPLMAFVMVLSYSRHVYLRFFAAAAMAEFLRGHVDAFEYFGGTARTLLYDNLKSAVLERRGDAVRFNPALLELAAHYHFLPKPCAPARGNEKGRVERAIGFVRTAFFAARSYTDLADLNRQAHAWSTGPALERRWPEGREKSVAEAFADEQPRLLALPDDAFPAEERVEVRVAKTPYVRFDRNDYSVPHRFVRTTLVVMASSERVRVLDGAEVVAAHERSLDRGRQIENPAHVEDLVEFKRQARRHRGIDRLYHAVPSTQELFRELAERRANFGAATTALVRLLDLYSAAELEAAVRTAIECGAPHVAAVRQILDHRRGQRGRPPAHFGQVSSDPRITGLVVRPHELTDYDRIDGSNTTAEENRNDDSSSELRNDDDDDDTAA